jgi:hypothetical protein
MLDLDKINSMTKYPSILTYHAMGEKGRLQDKVQVAFNEGAILTEKVDGVNSRIILFPDGLYIIGSREELLYAKGDLIENPTLGIVKVLKSLADKLPKPRIITVFYFEVFGGKTTKASKQYTSKQEISYRLFDSIKIPDYENILEMSVERIASWRDNNGQEFYNENNLDWISKELSIPLTPRLGVSQVPTGLLETYEWLKSMIKVTQVKLDSGGLGKPEGIVIRNHDRSKIAKLRFEDYERTLK